MTLYEIEERLRQFVARFGDETCPAEYPGADGGADPEDMFQEIHALYRELQRERVAGIDGKAARP